MQEFKKLVIWWLTKERTLIIQLIKYFMVAIFSTLCDLIAYYILCSCIQMNYLLASIFSFIIWFFVNYTFSVLFVFKGKRLNDIKGIIGVLLVSVSGLGVNLFSLWILVDILSYLPIIAKIIATFVCFVWNFVLRKLVIYK